MADYSSYVTIQLSTSAPALTLANSHAESGSFSPSPPKEIAAGTTGNFQLHDPSGPYGSQGSALYDGGKSSLSLSFACPYNGMNLGDAVVNGDDFVVDWYGKTEGDLGSGIWVAKRMPTQGHPVRLFVGVRLASEKPIYPPD